MIIGLEGARPTGLNGSCSGVRSHLGLTRSRQCIAIRSTLAGRAGSDDDVDMAGQSTAKARAGRARPRTVAIADDDEGVLHAMADLFRARPGWDVVGVAATGDQLVELVAAVRPDVVVSDVYLPAGEAPLFRRLHALVPRPEVVLAISARATASLRRKLLDAGADDLVRKGLDDPVEAVERLLDR